MTWPFRTPIRGGDPLMYLTRRWTKAEEEIVRVTELLDEARHEARKYRDRLGPVNGVYPRLPWE